MESVLPLKEVTVMDSVDAIVDRGVNDDFKPRLVEGDNDSLVKPSSCVVYVERVLRPCPKGSSAGGSQSASTISLSGVSSTLTRSSSLQRTKAAGMSMLQTMGSRKSTPPEKLDEALVAAFRESLHKSGIDTNGWGYRGAKSIEHLYWEAYKQRGCFITGLNEPGKIKRVTRLVKIRLIAEIFGVDHVLVSRMQFMHDGQTVERKQVPLRKLKWKDVQASQVTSKSEALYAEDCPFTESWRSGGKRVLEERLGLTPTWQQSHLLEESEMYRFSVEDDMTSDGYPGLNTLYCIHEMTFRVRDPSHPGVHIIGLPEGQEFATAEGDFNFGQHDEDGLSIGTQLNIWTWIRDTMNSVTKSETLVPKKIPSDVVRSVLAPPKPQADSFGAARIRRVPLPTSSARMLQEMQVRLAAKQTQKAPSTALWSCLETRSTSWDVAKKIAKSISNPKYSLQQFNEDLACFPELNLYLLEEKPKANAAKGDTGMSSGRTIGDEYQRTIGAFFAVYWMMRLEIDGKDGFCNGVDENWQPITLDDAESRSVMFPEKRMAFREKAEWAFFRRLLVKSGLLEEQKKKGLFKAETHYVVNEQRLVAMLALTAIHDIMKMSLILPTVSKEHAPYHGYAAGDTVGDHDHALSYLMDHFKDALPSFRDLCSTQQRAVQFTQCNLCFNHGWLVQAEAPPGAIFTAFRKALIRDHHMKIEQRDVAFYFVHWLTDLAGAEPTPLAGCEKFVTKFPLPVLNSFLRSFEFVEKITSSTETEVMEEYLRVRWAEAEPSLGPVPVGPDAVAKMRLLCMSQGSATAVLKGFDGLCEDDREVLSLEMARTGCACQSFSSDLVPKEASDPLEGPAFLVYYGPAFLQSLGNDPAVLRLSILAEIYRCARTLWPASIAGVDVSVTIRIDVIKNLSVQDLQDAMFSGDSWVLLKHNEREAFVEKSSKKKLNKMIAASQRFQVLDLSSCLEPYGGGEESMSGNGSLK